MNKDVLEQFGLDIQQTRLLFSMQRYIVEQDIGIEKMKNIKKRKFNGYIFGRKEFFRF